MNDLELILSRYLLQDTTSQLIASIHATSTSTLSSRDVATNDNIFFSAKIMSGILVIQQVSYFSHVIAYTYMYIVDLDQIYRQVT